MIKSFSYLFILSCLSISAHNINLYAIQKDSAYIKNSGVLKCFPEDTRTIKNGKEVQAHCEASAVAFANNMLIFANDKPILKPYSPVFSINYTNIFSPIADQLVTPLTHPNFIEPRKIEDFSVSLDNKYIFATTAFDWEKPEEPKDYNGMLIYWLSDDFNNVKTISVLENGVENENIRSYLNSVVKLPYYKIEGLAILPNNKILLGIREKGESYKKFSYAIEMISVSYQEIEGKIYLNNDFKLAYSFNNSKDFVSENVGLSSIEWDKYNDRLLLLTSYEDQDENIGAYLWSLDSNDLEKGNAPVLVKDNSKPFSLNNKAEGLTVLNDHEVFIINDDDRVLKNSLINGVELTRKTNEAIFNIVEFKNN
ncbi:hypothetical protein [Fluviispira sanaruensis]|uniref:Uncharacterized protein n=1 Tax=Fluviispira sanaruensis TaxID=2493639 RepID=A0A4V0P2G3_FLUSA|nr:hypothetical protein [Fluviispira sanaruensis]BBH53127.1 hypothetical protein JCM31447_15700 [Fluviispira sanaruensis]